MHEPTSAAPAPETPPSAMPVQQGSSTSDDLAGDPMVLQILSAEHFDLLSARGLAYNKAFTRGSMFLTFLSMSFVALPLLTQAMGSSRDFLVVAAIVLSFTFLIGVTTYARILDIVADDLRAMHGMNRIRHGYIQETWPRRRPTGGIRREVGDTIRPCPTSGRPSRCSSRTWSIRRSSARRMIPRWSAR